MFEGSLKNIVLGANNFLLQGFENILLQGFARASTGEGGAPVRGREHGQRGGVRSVHHHHRHQPHRYAVALSSFRES